MDQVLHPFSELLADDRVGHVDDELLVDGLQLLFDGKILLVLDVAAPLSKDLAHGEGFILRHVEVLDLVALDVLLLAADQIF